MLYITIYEIITKMQYNIPNKDAIVFTDRFKIDNGTMKQIKIMIEHPSMHKVRIMPDCHKGNGCCIGLTSELTQTIVPNFVGGDIGCGILAYPIGKSCQEMNCEKVEKIIRDKIKMGSGVRSIWDNPIATDDDITQICQCSQIDAYNFAVSYAKKFNVNDIMNYIPTYDIEWFSKLCKKINSDVVYDMRSMGTLGSGNHYVEICIDNKKNEYLIIHSGSKNFGSKICRYHQNKITENRRFDFREFTDKIKLFRRQHKDNSSIASFTSQLSNKMKENMHPDYLEKHEAYEYFFDMIFAQKYAQQNRIIMMKNVLNELKIEYDYNKSIESIHNYIDFNDLIIRKGAISAHLNQKCLISLNMRDGVLLCNGKGNIEWNMSSAHGAGRIMLREQAKSKISLRQFREEMKNVYSTTVNIDTIDESPSAYKDTNIIIKEIEPSVEILEHWKPIVNVKGV